VKFTRATPRGAARRGFSKDYERCFEEVSGGREKAWETAPTSPTTLDVQPGVTESPGMTTTERLFTVKGVEYSCE
jgi:hypothetical protein